MSEILPEQDCSFPDFTRKCVNYVHFKIVKQLGILGVNTMFTAFTSLHHVYLIIATTTKNNSHRLVLGWGESSSSASWISKDLWTSCLVTRESALLTMETNFHLGEDLGKGFTQIIPYPAWVTLPKLGNFTQAWLRYAGWVKLPWVRLGNFTQPG